MRALLSPPPPRLNYDYTRVFLVAFSLHITIICVIFNGMYMLLDMPVLCGIAFLPPPPSCPLPSAVVPFRPEIVSL